MPSTVHNVSELLERTQMLRLLHLIYGLFAFEVSNLSLGSTSGLDILASLLVDLSCPLSRYILILFLLLMNNLFVLLIRISLRVGLLRHLFIAGLYYGHFLQLVILATLRMQLPLLLKGKLWCQLVWTGLRAFELLLFDLQLFQIVGVSVLFVLGIHAKRGVHSVLPSLLVLPILRSDVGRSRPPGYCLRGVVTSRIFHVG